MGQRGTQRRDPSVGVGLFMFNLIDSVVVDASKVKEKTWSSEVKT